MQRRVLFTRIFSKEKSTRRKTVVEEKKFGTDSEDVDMDEKVLIMNIF